MNKLKRFFFNTGSSIAYALISAIFTIVPEECFSVWKIFKRLKPSANIIVNRLFICVAVFIIVNIICQISRKNRRQVKIQDTNYAIQIEYGDLFNISDGKVVINFDECFTTRVGENPADIKADSVCGQFLTAYPIVNMQELIDSSGIKPLKGKSEYKNQTRYKSGTVIPKGRFFITAFAKLDKNGRGYLTYEDYLDSLNTLWEQIDLYHGTSDVYMPILGSRITDIDRNLTQQELLDIMIASYILSPKRLKKPCTLHIICKKREGFSLGDIKWAN